ncbi:GNAT family N-acetyltransferase [Candidatus Lokiarchaeum ossiferum]|uniref:GNAT family N-acetyltransferase n=1 Tax=Candidatus Lokiarchaeum ossiferum TaxID=2951803 RepID=UPI00352DD099
MVESENFKEPTIPSEINPDNPKASANVNLLNGQKSSMHLFSKKNWSKEELRQHKMQIATSLKKAFATYPFFQEILPPDSKQLKKIQIWMQMIVNFGVRYASIATTSDNHEGIMIFHDSLHHPQESLGKWFVAGALRLIKWKLSEIKKFLYIDEIMKKIQKRHIPLDHIYLMVIGVSPDQQRKGYAKTLLEYLITYSKKMNLPIYLETYNAKNEAIYHRFGFKTMEVSEIPKTSLKMYSMLRSV